MKNTNIVRYSSFCTPPGLEKINKFSVDYNVAKGPLLEIFVAGLQDLYSEQVIKDILIRGQELVNIDRPEDKRRLRGDALKAIFNLPLDELEKIAANLSQK